MDILKLMNDLRIYLHLNIYNESNIYNIISNINKDNELVNVTDINLESKIITLKIKKMNMKKLSSYNNSVIFYYNIINQALSDFLITLNIEDEYIKGLIDIALTNRSYTNLLYNINIIDDTSIILYL